jgi:hypothetical protein
VLGGEAVLRHDHLRLGGHGQGAGQVPVSERRAHDVATTVQEQQRGRLLGVGPGHGVRLRI